MRAHGDSLVKDGGKRDEKGQVPRPCPIPTSGKPWDPQPAPPRHSPPRQSPRSMWRLVSSQHLGLWPWQPVWRGHSACVRPACRARRAAKEAKEAPAQPAPEKVKVEVKKFVKIGRPGYKGNSGSVVWPAAGGARERAFGTDPRPCP